MMTKYDMLMWRSADSNWKALLFMAGSKDVCYAESHWSKASLLYTLKQYKTTPTLVTDPEKIAECEDMFMDWNEWYMVVCEQEDAFAMSESENSLAY